MKYFKNNDIDDKGEKIPFVSYKLTPEKHAKIYPQDKLPSSAPRL